MYIYFYEYPSYSGITFTTFEKLFMKAFNATMVMLILQGETNCANGLISKVGK